MNNLLSEDLNFLLSPCGIRERTKKVFDLVCFGEGYFHYYPEKMDALSEFVIMIVRQNYPTLNIPYHSRWGHFKAGSIDRLQDLQQKIEYFDSREQARIKYDLVIPSVLLDAGAGPSWGYSSPNNKTRYTRSEGLAVASFDMFMNGNFSRFKGSPLRTDAVRLMEFMASDIEMGFAVTPQNKLEGISGRVQLMVNLGHAINSQPDFFPGGRPGGLVDFLLETYGYEIRAEDMLRTVLISLGSIWPGRLEYKNFNLGDVWSYKPLGGEFDSFIPFHKLSQWLTYSLIEPLEAIGVKICDLDQLTGLAEYRNGGLLLDYGLIALKDQSLMSQAHPPGSEIIIEWRAMTIQVLDQLADLIRKKLGFSEIEFPLAKVLEGGTWSAGRQLAREKRPDASPPLKISSDGTVF